MANALPHSKWDSVDTGTEPQALPTHASKPLHPQGDRGPAAAQVPNQEPCGPGHIQPRKGGGVYTIVPLLGKQIAKLQYLCLRGRHMQMMQGAKTTDILKRKRLQSFGPQK